MSSQELQRKSYDDARCDVDDECAIWKSGSHPAGYECAYPEAEEGAESASQRHQQIFLQFFVLLSRTPQAPYGDVELTPSGLPLPPAIRGTSGIFRHLAKLLLYLE